jgi:hypothetical protein
VPKAEALFQEHNYYGRSAVHYLSTDKPERLVYFCLHQQERYAANQNQALLTFEAELLALKSKDTIIVKNNDPLTADQIEVIRNLVDRHLPAMFGTLELETGSYQLTIKMECESTGAHFRSFRRPKQATAAISFSFPQDFPVDIQGKLKTLLQVRTAFVVYGTNEGLNWPTYSPTYAQDT